MANASVDLVTLSDLKARLGLADQTLSDAETAELERLITESSARFTAEVGDSLLLGNRVETRDGNGKTRMYLKNGVPAINGDEWVTTVSALTIDGATIPAAVNQGDPGWRCVDKDRLELVGYVFSNGRWIDGTSTGGGLDNVVVTYQSGYPADKVPQDIRGAVLELAAMRWKERDRIGQTYKVVAGEVTDFRSSGQGAPWATFLSVAALYRRDDL